MKEEKYSTISGSCHKALRSEAGAKVREWYESRGFGEELQSRFLLGANRDGDTAVIPYWCKGRIVGMIRRPIDHDGSGAKYIYSK